ncbi:MAG: DUF2791 family P-loop domain-containing protein [Clostridia bacterium]|nr:DUF2791 family P-loop domain-containing protein [Clostridia bacterium]
MFDFNARHIIEALRSGVPSREVGEYFSESRPGMRSKIEGRLKAAREENKSGGMVFTGRYGEGKTHMLHTAFNMAMDQNMVVSMVSLSKETPIDKPWELYRRLIANTWLPGASQPGFREKVEEMTSGSSLASEMAAYTVTELQTNKLYFLLQAMTRTQDEEERALFMADLEGDFVSPPLIKRSYRRINGTAARFSENFSKTKHWRDYFFFMSHFFRMLGYDGWVILLDEAELIGRMGKKTRLRSYLRMADFLKPDPRLEKTVTLLAFSESYQADVIEKRKEFQNVLDAFGEGTEEEKAATAVLSAILNAPELSPLSREEVIRILRDIEQFHALAYDWHPDVPAEEIYRATEAGGYLLRTKLRGAIELLDQLYQYGEVGNIRVGKLDAESLEEEEELPDLPEE